MKFFSKSNFNLTRKVVDVLKTFKVPNVGKKCSYSTEVERNPVKFRKWKSFRSIFTRWTPLSAGVYTVWLFNRNVDGVTEIEIECYSHLLPLRIVSKIWGQIANIDLPVQTRSYVYGKYSSWFNVNLKEAAVEDLTAYNSLADFFVRMLKPEVRKIDESSCLVSPCDGRILHCGPATSDIIEQVKGVTYTLEQFFGEISWSTQKTSESYYKSLLKNGENILHQCVIYLAPGDYHRFHSPCDWKAIFRRHFSGKLLSVNPTIAKLIPGLFCVNERVVYVGEWKHGFFSFTPVGATNVGSIEVYKDEDLKTNKRKLKYSEDLKLEKFQQHRGEMVGQFNMGSTIVLIFEAPKTFKFFNKDGDTVKMGEKLGFFEKDNPL